MLKERILFITTVWPFPATDGGKITTELFLEELSKYFEITLISIEKTLHKQNDRQKIREILTFDRNGRMKSTIVSLVSKYPASVMRYTNSECIRYLKERKDDFDLVFVDHSAVYLNIIKAFSRRDRKSVV